MKMKKFLAVFIAIMMILFSMGTATFAQEETLQDAVNAGGTITLTDDVYLTSTVIVPEGVTVTLDLNGYDITVSKNTATGRSLYAIDNYGTFTLTDSIGTGSITARGIENFAEMTVDSGKIVSCDSNGGAAIWNEGNLIINNGTFEAPYVGTANDFSGPGCLNVQEGASAVIKNGSFTSYNNRTYAIISYGDLTIENASVVGAHGAVSIDAGSTTIKNGTYSIANSNNGSDHAIYTDGGLTTITGGSFDGTKGFSTLYCENGKFVVSGGTYAEAIPADFMADGYKFDASTGKVISAVPALPTATITTLDGTGLTFALNFKADDATDEQLDYYGDWYADFVFEVNKDITFNAADDTSDGYLSGQYDAYSENWVNVPFENVSLAANTPLRVLTYALEGKLTEYKTPLTYNDVYTFVKEFNCGVFFNPEFLEANPDLEVTLELRMYNPDVVGESYTIGEVFVFNTQAVEGGSVGTVNWRIEKNILYVSGTGATPSYKSGEVAPWNAYSDKIYGIVIEDGIETIGRLSFAGLDKATSLVIAPSVKNIKNYAFMNCSKLATIDMFAVEDFGVHVFNSCDSLVQVNFEGTEEEYKDMVYDQVVESLEFMRATTTISDTENSKVAHAGMSIYATWMFDESTSTLTIGNKSEVEFRPMLNYPKQDMLPWEEFLYVEEVEEGEEPVVTPLIEKIVIDGVSNVGSRLAIGSTSLKEVEICEGVKTINNWAFLGTSALESIKLPTTITSIGTGAFYNIPDITINSAATYEQYSKIRFSKSNEEFRRSTAFLADATTGWHSGNINWHLEEDGTRLVVKGTGDMAALTTQPWAEYADKITEIVIEDGITSIGKSAFKGFVNVTEITVPSTVTYIKAAAFDGMTGLTTITLPSGLTKIGSYAFRGCDALATVNFAGDISTLKIDAGNNAFTNIVK